MKTSMSDASLVVISLCVAVMLMISYIGVSAMHKLGGHDAILADFGSFDFLVD